MIKTKLSKYLDMPPKTPMVLIFDVHNLVYRCLHIANFNAPEDLDFFYWRFLMINSFFAAIKQFSPDRVIFAIDHKHSWRKNIYKDYKGQRKEARNKSVIDFDKFYPVMDDFLTSFQKNFSNVFCIKADGCEADDIIAILCRERMEDMNKIIITTDNDMIQLLTLHRVKIYNPIKKKFTESLNPQMDLEIKILTGDTSDNIPKVKDRVGKGTAEKWIRQGVEIYLQEEDVRKNYERNKQLIDFDFIPQQIRQVIREQFDAYVINPYNEFTIFQWLLKNKINKYVEDLKMYSSFLKVLK